MHWFRSLLFNISFWLWTILLGIIFLPLLLIRHSFVVQKLPGFWVDGVLFFLRIFCGVDYRLIGTPEDGVVYASKHQSAFETLAFWRLLHNPAFILKRELLWIPIFGWYLAATNPIAIDRKAGASALKKIIRECEDRLKQGRSVVIFPEGTRTFPGESKPYQPGIAAIYAKLQPRVIPVALNSGKFWAKNSFAKRPGTISIKILEGIPQGLPKDQFMNTLQEAVEQASIAL